MNEYIEKGGDRGWDVIQFNWGLHAVKYVDERNANCDPSDPGAHIQFPLGAYAENLEAFVTELKRTGAALVFATTTPIPEGATGSIRHLNLEAYNDAARAIMNRHDIPVNDVYAFAAPQRDELQITDNVHFTTDGSQRLAGQVFSVLSSVLK